jgi:precorrin-3B synthase
MTARPLPKGWCPGAYRPMASGDGLIVRIRPMLARLNAEQLLGLCDASRRFGSGFIDLTNRANLQIRGVSAENHEALIDALGCLDLLDADPAIEGRRNILVAPDWQPGDMTELLARALILRLGELPLLPAKFGFAIDVGKAPVLGGHSADIRIERGTSGGLILRADGLSCGHPVTPDNSVSAAISMADWFVETRSTTSGRMAEHVAANALSGTFIASEAPAPAADLPQPGPSPLGPVYGLAFGQVEAADLAALFYKTCAKALRVTPARTIIMEGGRYHATLDFLTDKNDQLFGVDACPGAPYCASATVETRGFARRLAPHVSGSLHVSGCAKGCARSRAADTTLVGSHGKFDLVREGTAWDAPSAIGVDPESMFSEARGR